LLYASRTGSACRASSADAGTHGGDGAPGLGTLASVLDLEQPVDQARDILRPGHVAQGRDGPQADVAIVAGDLMQQSGHRRRGSALFEDLDEQGPAAPVLGLFHGVDERLVNAISEHRFQAVPCCAGRIAAVLDGLHQQGHGRAITNSAPQQSQKTSLISPSAPPRTSRGQSP